MNKLLFGSLAAAILAAAPLTVLADNHESDPDLASVWIIAPKTGKTEAFEKAMREHAAMREKGGDSRDWQVYSVALGDNMGIYQVRYCCFDWADQDAYAAENAEKEFGAHFQKTVMPHVDHMHHYIERMDFEMSSWPADLEDHEYYGVTSWVWKEGAGSASSDARKKIVQVLLDEGWGDDNHWLWHSRIGGKPMIMVAVPYENYADMAPPEQTMYEFLLENSDMDAEEIDATFEAFGSGFSSSDYTIWQSRPDLSVSTDD